MKLITLSVHKSTSHFSLSVCFTVLLVSRGVRFRSPVFLVILVFFARSCACRYLSIMLLCFRRSFSLHQMRSQYCSTWGRFDGPISCNTSLNHALVGVRLAWPRLVGHGGHAFCLLSRDNKSESVSPRKTSSQIRDIVWVNPCSRERHTYTPSSCLNTWRNSKPSSVFITRSSSKTYQEGERTKN